MSDNGSARVIVVGTNFGCLAHVRSLRSVGFDVRALVGRDAARTRARAERFGVPEALTSLDKALQLPGIDAVVIASPPETHRQFALQALAARKHVLCEKPLALNRAQAVEMLTAARRAGVVHMVEHQFRWQAPQVSLRRTIAEGAVGRPLQALYVMDANLCADPNNSGLPEWWLETRRGGGWLRNLGSHLIDIIRCTLGEFEGVCAGLSIGKDRNMNSDDGFTVHFRLRGGVEGMMVGSCRAWDFYNLTRVVGSAATASFQAGMASADTNLWLTGSQGRRPIPVPADLALPSPLEVLPTAQGASAYDAIHNVVSGFPEYRKQAEAFRNAITGRDQGPIASATFHDGAAHMAVIDAVEQSAASGEWVRVETVSE